MNTTQGQTEPFQGTPTSRPEVRALTGTELGPCGYTHKTQCPRRSPQSTEGNEWLPGTTSYANHVPARDHYTPNRDRGRTSRCGGIGGHGAQNTSAVHKPYSELHCGTYVIQQWHLHRISAKLSFALLHIRSSLRRYAALHTSYIDLIRV